MDLDPHEQSRHKLNDLVAAKILGQTISTSLPKVVPATGDVRRCSSGVCLILDI
jgi:hypothetical protein